jgi:hypothetical protein
MKTKLFGTILIGLSIAFYSCEKEVIPSGKITREQKSFTGYNVIDVSDALKVYLNFSETEDKIEVETNENLHKYIIVEMVSNHLVIKLQDHIDIDGDAVLNIYVTTKGITGFSASDASGIVLNDTLFADDINIKLSDASKFTGLLEVKNLSATLSDASTINLRGHADSYFVTASDASEIKDYAFETRYLNIKLSDASRAYVSVTGKMDVQVSDASNLFYKGTGTIQNLHISGASSVRKMD